MDTEMNNDTRGWIMTIVSGVACIFGASIICVDLLVRQIPSQRNFNLRDSDGFLAASMSLSFGVMMFLALYSMLPSSKKYLINAGFLPSTAAWILLACFTGGFVGISVLSRFFDHHIPSRTEVCDHSHKLASEGHGLGGTGSRKHSHGSHGKSRLSSHGSQLDGASKSKISRQSESTPLLSENGASIRPSLLTNGKHKSKSHKKGRDARAGPDNHERRPSMIEVPARLMSFVKDRKTNCSEEGPCFGYSDPCGQECFKHLGKPPGSPSNSRHPSIIRTETGGSFSYRHSVLSAPDEEDETSSTLAAYSPIATVTRSNTHDPEPLDEGCESDDSDLEGQHKHHHHVPENTYMNMGLQTSIAIALHKLPEGFITYATNHANPSLGFSVFMALFIHNIAEGFILAMPLYLALNSRLRAMMWAFLFGGISQPLGAAVAAAWFKVAGKEGHKPGLEVYGCMFGITAGIMAFVGLHLFVEGLGKTHNRGMCIAFAFVGMAIMGVSNALTS